MTKVVKGSRIRLKRTTRSGVTPTIPTTDDHTTGSWADSDIYIGEMFLNVDGSNPRTWFRDLTGTSEIQTTNSEFITNVISSSTTVNNTISGRTDNIIIDVSSTGVFTGITNIILDDLENGTSDIRIVHISLNIDASSGGNLTVNITSTSPTTVVSTVIDSTTILKGIILMWNGTRWVILSNIEN